MPDFRSESKHSGGSLWILTFNARSSAANSSCKSLLSLKWATELTLAEAE